MPKVTIEEAAARIRQQRGLQPKQNNEARQKYEAVLSGIVAQSNPREGGISRSEQSLGSRARDAVGGAMYGFSSLGRGVQSLLSRGVEAVTGKEDFGTPVSRSDFETEMNVDLDTGAGRTGNFVGEASLYATPGGASLRGGQLAFRGGTAAATEALSTDSVDSGTVAAGAANAFIPPAVSGVSKLFSNFLKGTGGVLSGKGSEVIEAIYQNPTAAREGLRNAVSLADDANTIRSGVSTMSRQASDDFGKALDDLPKRLGRTPSVINSGTKTTIRVGDNTYTLSKQGIKSSLTKALRRYDVEVNARKKAFDFSESPLDLAEEKRLREIFRIIDGWKDTTPKGFHKLSRKVRNYRKSGEQSQELNSIIDTVSRDIHGYIGKRVPAAKEMLNKYAKAQDVIEAFDQEFATKGSFVGGTSDRIRTGKKVANTFSGEKTEAKELLAANLDSGDDILARQAGRLLQDQVPRSGAAIGELLRSAINTVITPRMIGEVAATLGVSGAKAQALLSQLQVLEPAVRGTTIAVIANLLETGSE